VNQIIPAAAEANAQAGSRDLAAPVSGWLSWLSKGSLAVVDQALFAGTNFMVNILLARWLSPAEYGAFAVAFSVLLLVGAFHTACITEPMMVFGPGKYSSNFKKYLGVLLVGHFALMLPMGFLLVLGGLAATQLGSACLGSALVGAGIASPFILLLWLARRAFYVRLQPAWSAVGGALYLAVLLMAVGVLRRGAWFSPAAALIVMGIGALAVSVLLVLLLRPCVSAASGNPTTKEVTLEHWRYGRWSLGTVGLNWIPSNIYYVILPAWSGLGEAGALRALMNLAMPVLHSISALSMVLMPALVLDWRRAGRTAMKRTMESHCVLLFGGSFAYLIVLLTCNGTLLRLLYGDKYSRYGLFPLLMVGLLPFASAATVILGNALRALERPDRIFWCYAAASIAAIVTGIPLTFALGVSGALMGMFLSSVITSICMLWFYQRPLRGEGT